MNVVRADEDYRSICKRSLCAICRARSGESFTRLSACPRRTSPVKW
ncbi:hypothetical protein [Lysobacter gummosus]